MNHPFENMKISPWPIMQSRANREASIQAQRIDWTCHATAKVMGTACKYASSTQWNKHIGSCSSTMPAKGFSTQRRKILCNRQYCSKTHKKNVQVHNRHMYGICTSTALQIQTNCSQTLGTQALHNKSRASTILSWIAY